ncbi:hypothetical protein DL93DRAFT_1799909 [Clavulina sp. PMI_390]|nr:hypothetical protein DL93DRAFT_1799909 [Clavulina sp. PMI_390]
MLHKGTACLQCRKLKVKCDGLQPLCSRCSHLGKECDYPYGVAKRLPAAAALEARVLELELLIHQLSLPATHNLSLATLRLLERIERLGTQPKPKQLLDTAESFQRSKTPNSEDSKARRRADKILGEDITAVDLWAIQSVVVEELRSYDLERLENLPPSLSVPLINLFLPFRSHYYFLIDISHFTRRLSLSPSHPESIHPCLINACYLAACASNGGSLRSFIPHFLKRTQHFLQQSLMHADRITQFLWASVIVAVFFGRERRIVEAMVTAGAAIRFALACGLGLPGTSMSVNDGSSTSEYLLPPPKDKAEADDRTRLAHSIYVAIQAFPQVSGQPSTIPFEDRWSPISREASFKLQDGKVGSLL